MSVESCAPPSKARSTRGRAGPYVEHYRDRFCNCLRNFGCLVFW
jgi:hypothetical protein